MTNDEALVAIETVVVDGDMRPAARDLAIAGLESLRVERMNLLDHATQRGLESQDLRAKNERLNAALEQAEERARENEQEYAAADAHSLNLQAEVETMRANHMRLRVVMLQMLDEAERVVLSEIGSRYTRLREAVDAVRQTIGLGPLTDALTEYPIHISRREAMELSVETRRKVMERMTDAFMDALEVLSQDAGDE